jgi:chromosome segregation ATPase
MVWDGPEIAEDDRRWQEHADIAELVGRISSRRTPLEEANAAIGNFAATLGTDRNERLTLLGAGLLQTINAERSEIIQAIERYARRQRELADKIKAERADLDALHAKLDPSEEESARIKDLEKAFQWDTRVFDERRESLSYVCESPVLLEQRIFSLARHVMALLE